jgi:hypothetical protein
VNRDSLAHRAFQARQVRSPPTRALSPFPSSTLSSSIWMRMSRILPIYRQRPIRLTAIRMRIFCLQTMPPSIAAQAPWYLSRITRPKRFSPSSSFPSPVPLNTVFDTIPMSRLVSYRLTRQATVLLAIAIPTESIDAARLPPPSKCSTPLAPIVMRFWTRNPCYKHAMRFM